MKYSLPSRQRGFLLNPYRFGVAAIRDAVMFDGSTFLARGGTLTGITDTNQGTFSAWLLLTTSSGSRVVFASTNAGSSAGTVKAIANNSTTLGCILGTSSEVNTLLTYPISAVWRHLLFSFQAGGLDICKIYINDVYDTDESTLAAIPTNVLLAGRADWYVGQVGGGSFRYVGGLAELYFINTYIDLTVAANRRKFISATGKPVPLGSTGSLPTGTAPQVYLHLDDGEAPANFAINRGTGGNFSITGTLTSATSSPSD